MSESTKQQLDAAFRLRRVIVLISEKQPSFARAVIDQYLRFITTSPGTVRANGADFPQTVRRHFASAERSSAGTAKYPLLYFHIGNAILAFYRIDADPAVFEGRVTLLEQIAAQGIEQYVIHGDDSTGYKLATVAEAKALNAAAAAALEKARREAATAAAADTATVQMDDLEAEADQWGEPNGLPDSTTGDERVHDAGGMPSVRLTRPPGLSVRPRKGDGK